MWQILIDSFLICSKQVQISGSEEKLGACKNLGADVCINYKTEDFVARIKEETGRKGGSKLVMLSSQLVSDWYNITILCFDAGVDVILDNVGGPYLQRNLDSLNIGGRLFLIGFLGGAVTEVNLAPLLMKHLTVQGIRFSLFWYLG